MMQLLVRICGFLNKYEVEYLVIGGVAVVYHGYARTTIDIDLWYKPTLNNYHNIIKAFKEYGVDVSELENLVFDPNKTFLRLPTPVFRIELLPAISGNVSFGEARKKAETLVIANVSIPVISYDDLVETKKSTNRLKDLSDIEELEKRKSIKKS